MHFLFSIFLIFLPSRIKIICLRAIGAKIGSNCYIGFSVLSAEKIYIGNSVYIGHLNLIWRLKQLEIATGARINMLNWITGAGNGVFKLYTNSSVSVMHFFEASGNISIGANTVIAGRGSHFFSHGITSDNFNDVRPICIGDWCYVGSSTRFVPGSGLSDNTFLGMGAVVTKFFDRKYVLVGGVPAKVLKDLTANAVYFDRPYLPQPHHGSGYDGE